MAVSTKEFKPDLEDLIEASIVALGPVLRYQRRILYFGVVFGLVMVVISILIGGYPSSSEQLDSMLFGVSAAAVIYFAAAIAGSHRNSLLRKTVQRSDVLEILRDGDADNDPGRNDHVEAEQRNELSNSNR